MEDIKVGEYVRRKNGEIFKVTEVYPTLGKEIAIVKNEYSHPRRIDLTEEKHSFNLIDLIEVGDILEIELSEEFVERKDKKVFTRIGDVYTKEALQKDMDNGIIQEIKQILTHEQFESNAYKVKGE
mgnify:CR=1 FL=1